MSSSSSGNSIGASQHNARNEWNGAFSFSNIGLPGEAFEGGNWKSHARKLREIFANLLTTKEKPQGILLCEVGNRSDPITPEGKEKLEEVLELAFQDSGASEHGSLHVFWSSDETVAAFKSGSPSGGHGATYANASGGSLADSRKI